MYDFIYIFLEIIDLPEETGVEAEEGYTHIVTPKDSTGVCVCVCLCLCVCVCVSVCVCLCIKDVINCLVWTHNRCMYMYVCILSQD